MKISTKQITKIGMLVAAGVVLMYLEIPILPAFPYLKLDFADLPVLLGGFAFGPIVAIIIEILKNVIHFIIKNDGTGGIGNLANILVGCALCVPAAIIYKKRKNRKGALMGLVVGIFSMIAVGVLINYFVILPLYGIVDETAVRATMIGGIIPINAIKGISTAIITYILYKPLSPILHK